MLLFWRLLISQSPFGLGLSMEINLWIKYQAGCGSFCSGEDKFMAFAMELIILIVCATGLSIGIIGDSLYLANKLTLKGKRVFQIVELGFLLSSIILSIVSFFA